MRLRRKLGAIGTGVTVCALVASSAQAPNRAAPATGPRGARLVSTGSFTELHVDGAPFFVHAASFPYFRLPADLWERSLQEYRRLGINTIELRVPWNWHEPQQNGFDFEGRTNSRRDLRRLLRLIAERELKLIVWMNGEVSGWRSQGAPEWSNASTPSAFMTALFKELTPYFPAQSLRIPDREARKAGETKEISGPLIALVAPELPSHGAIVVEPDHGPVILRLPREADPAAGRRVDHVRAMPGIPPPSRIDGARIAELETEASLASVRRGVPSILTAVDVGAAMPEDEARPAEGAQADALLTSRLLLGNGVNGLVYAAIQDSLTPAGYSAEGVNRFARVDVALDINASRIPGARNIVRNGMLVEKSGATLASSHKRADFGIVTATRMEGAMHSAQQLSRAAALSTLSAELVEAERAPAERLPLYALLVMPVPAAGAFTEATQKAIVEYVQGGGTLVVYPRRPPGALWETFWQTAESQPGARRIGDGQVIEVSSDPAAWIDVRRSHAETYAQEAMPATAQELRRWMAIARTQPAVRREKGAGAPLLISQIVSNAGTLPLGERSRDGSGLLSVTNLSGETAEEEIQALSPRLGVSARGSTDIPLALTVPARESLLLPLHAPLCSAPGKDKCDDEIVIAGAEFLWAEREGKTLELTFYAPVRATLRLRLAEQPSRVRTDEMSVDGLWTPASRQFEISIPRGPAPDYLRVVRIQLPYTPHVPEKPDPEKTGRRDYEFAVSDAVRFPLSQDAALETYPPLIILKGDHTGRMVMRGKNYDLMGRDISFRLDGPIKGDDGLGLDAGELGFERMDLKPTNGNGKAEPGFLEGKLQARSGRDNRSLPVSFVAVDEKGTVPYKFDFDRDGAAEWVLEDDHLRIVTSPENGGRIVALTDKESGLSLTTNLGLLHDVELLATADPGTPRGYANSTYSAEWLPDTENTGVRLTMQSARGARIEKDLRITEKQSFEVRYRWSGETLEQSALTSVGSVPVTLRGDSTTRFCWEKPAPKEPSPPSNVTYSGAPEMECEVFSPHGKPVQVPDGIHHVEVRTPGSFALRLEWQAGRMRVFMKNYSAELRLEFPRAEAGARAAENLIRYRAVVVE